MSVWPPRPEPPTTSGEEPRVVDIDSEDADPIFDALGSETARELLSLLYEEPRPASELAEVIGCSLPNVDYHLSKLETAELVEPVEEWYSRKGAEMTVYAPTGRSLVLFAGVRESGSLREHLTEAAGVAVLAVGGGLLARAAAATVYRAGEPTTTTVPTAGSATPLLSPPDAVGLAFALGVVLAVAAVAVASREGGAEQTEPGTRQERP